MRGPGSPAVISLGGFATCARRSSQRPAATSPSAHEGSQRLVHWGSGDRYGGVVSPVGFTTGRSPCSCPADARCHCPPEGSQLESPTGLVDVSPSCYQLRRACPVDGLGRNRPRRVRNGNVGPARSTGRPSSSAQEGSQRGLVVADAPLARVVISPGRFATRGRRERPR